MGLLECIICALVGLLLIVNFTINNSRIHKENKEFYEKVVANIPPEEFEQIKKFNSYCGSCGKLFKYKNVEYDGYKGRIFYNQDTGLPMLKFVYTCGSGCFTGARERTVPEKYYKDLKR